MKTLHIYIALLFAALGFAACNDIAEGDRFERVDRVEARKNVLIEEFTGQRCLNCPLAAERVEEIQRLYPENVIAVAIHGGALAVNEEKSAVGLANAQGEAYTAQRGVTSWPTGVVDRCGAPADFETWAGSVLQRLLVEPRVGLEVSALNYDPDTRRLAFTARVTASETVEGRLTAWLVEDSIVTTQAMPAAWSEAHGGQTYDRAYRADHVFRAAVGEADGLAMALSKGQTADQTFDIVIKEAWHAPNVRIVAFFTTDSGVEQVVQTNILNQ